MAKLTYWEKLKDPRWQRKRLDAMQAAEVACQRCMDGESTLHVHHKQYFKGREPWEYDIGQLAVLCESCHESQHEREDAFNLVGSYLDLDGPWDRDSVASLVAGFVQGTCPMEAFEPFSYLAGSIARELAPTLNYYDLEMISRCAFEDRNGLYEAMLAYAKAHAKKVAA